MAETTPTQRLHLVMGGRVIDPRGIERGGDLETQVAALFGGGDGANGGDDAGEHAGVLMSFVTADRR